MIIFILFLDQNAEVFRYVSEDRGNFIAWEGILMLYSEKKVKFLY